MTDGGLGEVREYMRARLTEDRNLDPDELATLAEALAGHPELWRGFVQHNAEERIYTEGPPRPSSGRPRRIAITSDDVLWYSDYARGYLGRFDPATGKASEWLSPGGDPVATVRDCCRNQKRTVVQRSRGETEYVSPFSTPKQRPSKAGSSRLEEAWCGTWMSPGTATRC